MFFFFRFLQKNFNYVNILVRNAGKPITNPIFDICNNGDAQNKITIANRGIILQSPNHPNYPTTDTRCTKQIVGPSGTALKAYLTVAGFKTSNIK